ncbi:hypothetical protein F441_13409 [Phytophthora nicotianae CJ01A1]|uniref:Uncharacterized protein n=1 Tax=Phytophthora nicotianae CJ01A1 TaxID=1317063 RepID=W2WLP6_PHYNI|nr:hypothetical protein F441_13409 [Phytophthora nicotianae CJ01A1]
MLTLDEALAFIAFCDDEIRDPMPKESMQGLCSSFMLDDIDDLLDPVVQGMISVESGNTPSPKPISSLPQLLTVSPTRPRKRIRRAHFDELMSDLEGEVDVTYANFHRMCLPLQDTMLYGNSELSYGERCKANGMEFTTTTPLSWPMTSAFTHVWNMLESSLDRSRNPNTLERRVNLTIPIPNGTSCHFHKLHFLRKFEENDRVIIIWSDLMQMTTRNVRLRSLAYAVFTPSKIDPSQACIMYTFLKLYVEPTSYESVSRDDIRYAHEVVMSAFGRLMRTFWQNHQNRLLEVTSRPDTY